MKNKKIMLLPLLALMGLTVVSCGDNTSPNQSNETFSDTEKQTESDKKSDSKRRKKRPSIRSTSIRATRSMSHSRITRSFLEVKSASLLVAQRKRSSLSPLLSLISILKMVSSISLCRVRMSRSISFPNPMVIPLSLK